MTRTRYQHVIWDWNGTLLDDVRECLAVLNEMLARRGLGQLTEPQYRDRFDFPVLRFYEDLGFDFDRETFDDVAREYHDGYVRKVRHCRLQSGARQILHACGRAGVSQSLLSAYHRQRLQEAVEFFQLQGHFLRLIGMNDYYAHSKVETGKLWVRQLPYPPEDILFIGDTTHDFEVARAMGTDCVLVSFGHQSAGRLSACGTALFDSLEQLQDRILS